MDKPFQEKATFKEHHTDENGKIKCPRCDFAYNTLAETLLHFRNHKLEPCSICGDIIAKPIMVRHLQVKHYVREKNFNCETCGKVFLEKKYLEAHFSIHTGAKPFVCRYCEKGFSASGSRWNHERLVHKVQKKS